jgi:hypothetical protein
MCPKWDKTFFVVFMGLPCPPVFLAIQTGIMARFVCRARNGYPQGVIANSKITMNLITV